jgi:hypothetical protein
VNVVRPLRLILLFVIAVGCVACGRMQARTPPPVAMLVPPSPPRVAIPVSLPEPPVIEPEPAAPAAPPAEPTRPRPDTAPPRTVEKPAPPPTPAAPETPAPVLQTTTNVGAIEQRASWLLAQAEKNLERVNRGQLAVQARAQFDRAMSFVRNARDAMQRKNFNYAEQLALRAARLAQELVKG